MYALIPRRSTRLRPLGLDKFSQMVNSKSFGLPRSRNRRSRIPPPAPPKNGEPFCTTCTRVGATSGPHRRRNDGWDLGAVWEDIKFATRHCRDIEKIAMVGEHAWEKWMATICKPFTMSSTK